MSSIGNGWNESAEAWIADMGAHGDFGRRFVLDPIMPGRARAASAVRALDVGCGEGCDPRGHYLQGVAEALPFPDRCFDLVVSYLTLIDIPDVDGAVREMARVLAPGGTLLIANLTSFSTPGADRGWVKDEDGQHLHNPIDDYLDERAMWVEWLVLRWFDEPEPLDSVPAAAAARYRRAPWFLVMEWRKT